MSYVLPLSSWIAGDTVTPHEMVDEGQRIYSALNGGLTHANVDFTNRLTLADWANRSLARVHYSDDSFSTAVTFTNSEVPGHVELTTVATTITTPEAMLMITASLRFTLTGGNDGYAWIGVLVDGNMYRTDYEFAKYTVDSYYISLTVPVGPGSHYIVPFIEGWNTSLTVNTSALLIEEHRA